MGFYESLEEGYYSFMDSLEDRGIKVYEFFINPVESHGIPSFPLFSLIILLLIGGAAFLAFSALSGGGANLSVQVVDAQGNTLDNVIVQLAVGDDVRRAKTSGGVATFSGIPHGQSLTVSINEEGFKPYTNSFSIEGGKAADSVRVTLESAKANELFLFVSDDSGFPVSLADVRFTDPKTGELVSAQTDAQGKVSLRYASATDILNVRVTRDGYQATTQSCFASQSSCEAILSSTTGGGGGGGGGGTTPPREKAGIRVEVLDQNGDGVDAKVVLFHGFSGERITDAYTDSLGVAFFSDAVDLGTDVYVSVDPSSDGFQSFSSEVKTTTRSTEFFIQLRPATPVPPGGTNFERVSFKVVDADKKPVENALVKLYFSQPPLRAIGESYTDSSGDVAFDVAANVRVYATVFASGFLPLRSKALTGGEFTQLVLTSLKIGNHGSLTVNVQDETGAPISFASVTLSTHDGFALGVPSQETLSDGSALFEGLPLERVKALAVFGAQKGQSDIAELGVEPKEITVVLQPAQAFVSATVLDAVTKQKIPATVTAYKFQGDGVIGSCQTEGNSCVIEVPADREIYLVSNASGYGSLTGEEFQVLPDQTVSKVASLLPNSLTDELRILDVRLEDLNGQSVSLLDQNLNVQVNRGDYYHVLLSANLPSSAQKAGTHMRIGELADVSEEKTRIVDYSKPATAEVVKATGFNPGPSCAQDLGDQNGPVKWVEHGFTEFGAKTVRATVFVDPSATKDDELVVSYRVYAKAGDVYLRQPDDPRYEGLEKTASLDSCYAQTVTVRIPITEGRSTCNDDACLSALFYTETASAANGLRVDLDQPFAAAVGIRSFTTLDAPFLRVKTDPSLQVLGYDFGSGFTTTSGQEVTIPLSFFQRTQGNLTFKPIIPTQNARVSFAFGDASGSIVEAQRFVVVQGTGQFNVAGQPLELLAQQRNTLTVSVLSQNGQAVTDAKLTFKEVQGSAFNGFPNGPETLLGDNSEGRGKDGTYRFEQLRPESVGSIAVDVERDGFAPSSLDLVVSSDEPLSFSQDPTLIDLSCDEPTRLGVSSAIESKLRVAASFSGTACANLQVLGSGTGDSASFDVKPGKDTTIIIDPKINGQCLLVFNAETPSGQALGTQEAWLSADCEKLGGGDGSVNASPTPPATLQGTCAAQGGQCVPSGQRCPSGFVSSDYNTLQSQYPNPYTGPTPTPQPGSQAVCTDGQTCCKPVDQVCQPPIYNFQNILAKYLGYYAGVQTLSNYPQQVTSASAPIRLAATPQGVVVTDPGKCQRAGNGLTCTKPVYAILPTNALAFSVENQLFADTTVLLSNSAETCFSVEEVGQKSGFYSVLGNVRNQLQSGASLLTRQTRTYVITFRPTPQCVAYSLDENGAATLSLTEAAKSGAQVAVRTSSGIAGTQFILNFQVAPKKVPADQYAFIAMPTGEVAARGDASYSFEEPAVFVNNLQATEGLGVDVSGKSVPSKLTIAPTSYTPAILRFKKSEAPDVNAVLGNSNTKVNLKFTVVDAPTGLDGYDVVGNTGAVGEGFLQCSRTGYCTPDQVKKVTDAIRNDLDAFAGEYVANVDTLAYENAVSGTQQIYQQAFQDALREYLALRSQYDACVRSGQDPLRGTNQYCQQNSGQAPIYPYAQGLPGVYGPQGFYQNPYSGGAGSYPGSYPGAGVNPYQQGYNPYQSNFYPGQGYYPSYVSNPQTQQSLTGAFGDGWMNAGCNSDILNAFQLQGQVGLNQFNPVQQQYMQSARYSQGVFSQREPVLSNLQPKIIVPIKEAGPQGGIKLYTFTADLSKSSPTGEGGFTVIDRISSGTLQAGYLTLPYHQRPATELPSGDSGQEKISGFPYLEKDKASTTYKLKNWGTTTSVTVPSGTQTHLVVEKTQAQAGSQSTAGVGPAGVAPGQPGATGSGVTGNGGASATGKPVIVVYDGEIDVEPSELSRAIRFSIQTPTSSTSIEDAFDVLYLNIYNPKTGTQKAATARICKTNTQSYNLGCDLSVQAYSSASFYAVATGTWLINLDYIDKTGKLQKSTTPPSVNIQVKQATASSEYIFYDPQPTEAFRVGLSESVRVRIQGFKYDSAGQLVYEFTSNEATYEIAIPSVTEVKTS
ncbi:hypothetical protein HY572_04240 [Candidatus Micrarchaeota archaeon]|nr:hypothetical protein [Candidatus Micrarchaeota archaeon]